MTDRTADADLRKRIEMQARAIATYAASPDALISTLDAMISDLTRLKRFEWPSNLSAHPLSQY